MHQSSTSTYKQISLKSTKLFVAERMDGWADGHLRPALLGRLGGVDLTNKQKQIGQKTKRKNKKEIK